MESSSYISRQVEIRTETRRRLVEIHLATCRSNTIRSVRGVRARSARISIIFLFHLPRRLARVTYTSNESHPCHSIVSLTRNNTTRMLRKYLTRASRSNTGTAVLEDKKNPVWNHKVVEEDIDLREMKTIRLDIRDKDTYTRDSVIGYVDIDIQSLHGKPESTNWHKIHPLKDAMRGSLQVRIRVYNKGDDDESERNNVVSSHVLNVKSEKKRVLFVERPNSYSISNTLEILDLRLMTKCEITGGDDKVTDLRYLTAVGQTGSLFLRAKDAKLFESLVEKAKKMDMSSSSSLNENVFDVTVDAFRRDREKGQGGDFCIIALNSVHAIVAYDFKTHSIHEIENVSADADVLKIVNKGGTSTFFLSFFFFLIRVLPSHTHTHTYIHIYCILR